MRIGQTELLTEQELSLLLYVTNILEPVQSPKIEIGLKELPWLKHEAIIWKLEQHQPNLTDEGQEVFKSLMTKLNKSPTQEREDYEHSTNTKLTQSEFQF